MYFVVLNAAFPSNPDCLTGTVYSQKQDILSTIKKIKLKNIKNTSASEMGF